MFHALFTVSTLIFLSRIVTVIRDLVIAHQYGINDKLDAFLIAYAIPIFATGVISSSITSAFIPTYIQVRENEGKKSALKLFSSVIIWNVCLLVALSLILGMLGPILLPMIGAGFDAEKMALTRSLFWVMLPLLITNGLISLWGSILNAGERFALAAIVPIVTPLVTILTIYLMIHHWGIYALPYGALLGSVLEMLILIIGLKLLKIPVFPLWMSSHPALKQVMKQIAPMFSGSILMSSTTIIDQAFAARAGSGGVSTLSYAYKVVGLMVGVGGIAIGTSILPFFSRMVAAEDWAGIRRTLSVYTKILFIITLPVTFLMMWQSELIVRLVFQRGSFTAEDTKLVAAIQRLYLLQFPTYIMGMLFVRLISAMKANHILFQACIINLCLNIVLNILFLKMFGLPGIALSTSVVYLTSLCYVVYTSLCLMRKIS